MKSVKVRLELNGKQTTLARKHAGTARFAYNWGLAKSHEAIENSAPRPSSVDLHKLWVAEVKSANKWTYEVSKCAPQQALRNLDEAYRRVFKVKGTRSPRFNKRPKESKINSIWKDQSKLKKIESNCQSSAG